MSEQQQPWIATPLVESAALSRAAGCRIFLKLENTQPSGSFKSRGIGNYMLRRLAESASPENVHFYSSSGGNAGLAAVHAANALHRPATIVVPLSTKPFMISKLRTAGAHAVVQHGATWADADRHLRASIVARDPDGVYVPPFDHPDVWAGNAGMVRELREQLSGIYHVPDGRPAAIVCSVGGGGLFNGVVQGVEEFGWGAGSGGVEGGVEGVEREGETTVVAVETRGAASLNASLCEGQLVTLPGITSLATSLGAVRVAERTFANARKRNVRSVVLEDGEAAMGCWKLADEERVLVEMACGVNVALCYGGRLEGALGRKPGKEDVVVIVVCGGSNVTVEMVAGWRTEFGDFEPGKAGVSNGV